MDNTNPRMLVVMPYWDGDKEAACDSAILADELISRRSDETGFLFVYRNDSSPPSSAVIQKMREKFGRVDSWKCDRKGVGFPMGPNEMYFGIFSVLVNRTFNFEEFDFVFIMESDVVVTRRNWHLELVEEWKRTGEEGKFVSGAMIQHGHGGYHAHINASALYDRKILRRLPELIGCDGNLGWDYFFGRSIIPLARSSPLFQLDYARPTISCESAREISSLVYHGVKDDSLRRHITELHQIGKPTIHDMSPRQYADLNGFTAIEHEDGSWALTKRTI